MALAAPVSISLKRWNSFPASLKTVFAEAGIEHDQRFARGMIEGEATKLKEFTEKRGVRVIKLPPAEQAALEKAGKDAQEQWLVDMEKKNVPARATWAYFQKLQTECDQEIASRGYPWARK
jgi:TRAP-type C4-dicarboxylate transport system substrate-binding protein